MMVVLFLVICKIVIIDSANILGIITTPSYSHQAPFQPLWRELALRGHKVTVITTDPQKNASITNLKEIDISHTYKIYEKYKVFHVHCGSNMSFVHIGNLLKTVFNESQEYQLSLPEVQNLINNRNVKFDLVITETQSPIMMSFAWRFQCPLISVSSMDAPMTFHDSVGNVVHPYANPDMNLDILDPENMGFLDRMKSFFYNVLYRIVFEPNILRHTILTVKSLWKSHKSIYTAEAPLYTDSRIILFHWLKEHLDRLIRYHIYKNTFPRHHEQAKKFFGEGLPPFIEIQNNISALFISTHPVTHTVRPTNLNTISIGFGTVLKKPKPLPESLQKYLDKGKDGVIYFCLGSNIIADMLAENFIDNVIKAFAEVPYQVLMKLDYQPENLPSNIRIEKWVPQQDVLRHPNVKLFITHGGLQSLQEGIHNGKPVIGIPICGDAFFNINKMVSMGYGKRLDVKSLTKESLRSTIIEVIQNPKYTRRAQELMAIFRDEEVPTLERAIYWTEYIIRHKGAKHLRSPLIDMPIWKYYMLDMYATLALVLILYISVILFASMKVVNYIRSKFLCKPAQDKGKKNK